MRSELGVEEAGKKGGGDREWEKKRRFGLVGWRGS